jgi:hypothetical protein
MPKTPTKTRKTQKTPKGYEIPIPTRREFYEALEKVAKKPKELAPKKRKESLS